MKLDRLKSFSAPILRISMSLVFIWFSISQFQAPTSWTGFVPEFATNLSGLDAKTLVLAHAVFEMIFGISLLIGIYTRFVAFLLAIHLLAISFSLGYNAIAIRDLGLSVATISVFLHGPDKWSLMKKIK